jgi:hypothetical protein
MERCPKRVRGCRIRVPFSDESAATTVANRTCLTQNARISAPVVRHRDLRLVSAEQEDVIVFLREKTWCWAQLAGQPVRLSHSEPRRIAAWGYRIQAR